MSVVKALKTIKLYNRRFTRQQCINQADKYINLISNKYPEGVNSNVYFVIPGYEHITKNQPVVVYSEEGEFKLSTNNMF